jgi:hypothetical protein
VKPAITRHAYGPKPAREEQTEMRIPEANPEPYRERWKDHIDRMGEDRCLK